MQIQKTNYNPQFTAIKADRIGKALIKHRINNCNTKVNDWKELVDILEYQKHNPNQIFITKKGGDNRLKMIITHAASGFKKRIYEGIPQFESPIDFIKRGIEYEKLIDEIFTYKQ